MANSNATPATSTTRPSSPKYLQHQINTTAELRPLKALNLGGATGRALTPNLIPLKSTLAVHVRLLGFDISHTGEATLSTARPECMPAVSAQVPTYRKHAISSAAAQSSRRLGESPMMFSPVVKPLGQRRPRQLTSPSALLFFSSAATLLFNLVWTLDEAAVSPRRSKPPLPRRQVGCTAETRPAGPSTPCNQKYFPRFGPWLQLSLP